MPPRKLLDDDDRPIRGRSTPQEREKPEREPLSWREKDRSRDRSSPVSGQASASPRPDALFGSLNNRFKAEAERKNALSAAEALFANPGKEGLERKLLNSTPSTLEAVGKEYIEKYGYPEHFEALCRLVEHPSGEISTQALEKLKPLLSTQTPARKQTLFQALQLLTMTAKDPQTRKAATAFLRRSKT